KRASAAAERRLGPTGAASRAIRLNAPREGAALAAANTILDFRTLRQHGAVLKLDFLQALLRRRDFAFDREIVAHAVQHQCVATRRQDETGIGLNHHHIVVTLEW